MKNPFWNLLRIASGIVLLGLLAACAKDLGLTGGQGSATDPDFLKKEAYELNREDRLQRDMNAMWATERVAGHGYSTVEARAAIRRVFADINLHFKGTKDEFLNFMSGSPSETKPDRLVYRIEAPSYTDEYYVIFGADNVFQSVDYYRIPRIRKDESFFR